MPLDTKKCHRKRLNQAKPADAVDKTEKTEQALTDTLTDEQLERGTLRLLKDLMRMSVSKKNT